MLPLSAQSFSENLIYHTSKNKSLNIKKEYPIRIKMKTRRAKGLIKMGEEHQ